MTENLNSITIDIYNRLSSIKETDSLLEQILVEIRPLVNADAGSVYVPIEYNGNISLQIKASQNDTLQKKLNPGEKLPYLFFNIPVDEHSICGYVAKTGKVLNIPDVYCISDDKPYSQNTISDKITDYKSRSMLTIPLKNVNGNLLLVIQLINAKDEKGNIIYFTQENQILISHILSSVILPVLQLKTQSSDRLKLIVDTEKRLAKIHDKDILLEQILFEIRQLVHADAGSIYEVDNQYNPTSLQIKYGQNDTRQNMLKPGQKLPYTSFSFPINEKSICGFVAKNKKSLNIPDVYQIPEQEVYKFNRDTDLITGYRTTSMFTVPLLTQDDENRLIGVIQIINAKDEYGNVIPFSSDSQELINHFSITIINLLQQAYRMESEIRKNLKMCELRDPKETYKHVERVSKFSIEIYDKWASNHNLTKEEMDDYRDKLAIASKFHDAGKIGISDIILRKPAKFTPEERDIMKGHTCFGALIFEEGQNSKVDKMSYEVALHHHERWDGGEAGYPGKVSMSDFEIDEKGVGIVPKADLLAGLDIPLAARIVSIADVFDALSHRRCYKDAWSINDAFNEIENCSGTQFDPELVSCFLDVKDRIVAINDSYMD